MGGRGAYLLQVAAGSIKAASWAAGGAACPELFAATASAPAAAGASAAGYATAGSPLKALAIPRNFWKAAAAGANAPGVAPNTSAGPWVARGLMRMWRSSGPGHGPGGGVSGRMGNDAARNGSQSTVLYGVGWRAAAEGPAAAAAGISAPPQGLSRRPMGLLAAAGRRLAANGVGATAGVAAGVAIGATAIVAATPWAPQAGASAVRSVWRDSRGYEHFQGRGHGWSAHNPRLLYGTAAVATAAVAYYWYCLETVPYTGRRHAIMLVSPNREQWMGKMGFEQFKALARAEHKLLPDSHPDVQRVVRLGRAIAAVAADGGGGGHYEHMRGLQWEFAVINDPMVNAAVLPGGKVIVFSGLLRLLDRNDDELAAVMAHEVGHVLARHPAENMSTLNVWLLINTALRITLGFALPDVAMYLALILPNSRKNEHEADVIGLRLMARACFDPAAATSMLGKLNRAEREAKQGRALGASLPPFLSTHPLTTDRVKLLEGDLPEAYKLFDQSGCASVRSDLRRALEAWPGGGWGDNGGGFRSL